ncbi:MAG: sodium:calcium antiporter, partial [Planctomycetes bacterium]|nr:sodium:calcium antiporter [Planctomycetota bacterium]
MLTQWFFPDRITTELLFGELLLAGLFVVLVAVKLTRLADRFSDEWKMGKAFVGMLLLATVTSLPEVVAGATAGAIGSVDMAFAAIYGSCSFNIV